MKKGMFKKLTVIMMTCAMTAAMAACGGSAGAGQEESSAASQDGSGTSYKIGIVKYVDDASLNQIENNIKKELDAKQEELGVDFDYENYVYNGQGNGSDLNQIASSLIADEVDLIIPIATPTAQIMQSATEDKDIPIVFSAVSDPVGAKLVDSMEAPGANITGTSDMLNTEAIMNLIFAAKPDTKYVGLLYSNSEDASKQPIADAKAFLDEKGIKYVEKTGTTNDEVAAAADALVAEGVDAVFTPTDNTIMTAELGIFEKFSEAKIPHYCGADSFALNGAFCGYGEDYANIGVATADMAVDILVNGSDPASTPVQTFDNGIALINTETCEAIGYKLDDVKAAFEPFCTAVDETTTAKEFEK